LHIENIEEIKMDKIKEMAARSSINNMLKSNHFSICAVDKVADMYGQKAGGEAYQILSALHCVDYSEMEEELRAEIPAMIALSLQFENIPSSIKSSSNVIEMRELVNTK
jgi:hypothetical protein